MEGWSRPRGRGLSRRGVGLPPGAGPFLAWVELSPGARSFQERGGAVSGGGAFPGERWSRSRGRGPAHRFGALSQEAEDARPRGEVILRGGGVFLRGGSRHMASPGLRVSPGVWEPVLQAHLQAGLSPGRGHCDLPRLPEAPRHCRQPGLVLRPGWEEVRPCGQGGRTGTASLRGQGPTALPPGPLPVGSPGEPAPPASLAQEGLLV